MRHVWLVVACGGCTGVEILSSDGELGRLSFSVMSDFYVPGEGIGDTPMVTGYPQTLLVALTPRGQRFDDRADEIVYTIDLPGVTVQQTPPEGDRGEDDTDASSPPALTVLATDEGTGRLTAEVDGEVVDYVDVAFAAPTDLEMVMFSRAPWTEPFVRVQQGEGALPVDLGAQLAWLAVPVRDGERLIGGLTPDVSADPLGAIVPGANVENVNEDEAQSFYTSDSLYFVMEGPVTVSWTDTANGVAGQQLFQVGPTTTVASAP